MDAASALLGASRRMSLQPNPTSQEGGSTWGNAPLSPGAGSNTSNNSWVGSSPPTSGHWNSETGSETSSSTFMTSDKEPHPFMAFGPQPLSSKFFRSTSVSSGGSSNFSASQEGQDKAGNLPSKENMSWFTWKPRPRAMSEAGGTAIKDKRDKEIGNWLSTQESGSSWLAAGRIRRSSSRDVEEAMSGGLTKADIYMPPI